MEPAAVAFVGTRIGLPGAQRSRPESTSLWQGLRRACATCALASLGWAVLAGAQDYTGLDMIEFEHDNLSRLRQGEGLLSPESDEIEPSQG